MINDRRKQGETAFPSFIDILREMNLEGGFDASVLATDEGLPIASVPNSPRHELAGTMAAVLHQVSAETRDQLGLPVIDEITIRTGDKTLLVCRPVRYAETLVILGALVPPDQAYRRATNRAVRRIMEELDL